MKVIFPVAGRGTRFLPHSSVLPKCLFPVKGRLMIEWAMASIWHRPEELVFIYHRSQQPLISYALAGLAPRANLVEQTEDLKGASHSLLQAAALWRDESDVVVVDCDIYADSAYGRENWQVFDGDGSVLTFASNCPSKSYVEVRGGNIVRAIEKQVISPWAIGGIYHFRSGRGLLQALERQLQAAPTINTEFYLSGALDIYCSDYPDIRCIPAKCFHDLGTPAAVAVFEKESEAQ